MRRVNGEVLDGVDGRRVERSTERAEVDRERWPMKPNVACPDRTSTGDASDDDRVDGVWRKNLMDGGDLRGKDEPGVSHDDVGRLL